METMMSERLAALIAKRMAQPPQDCRDALRQIILAACDFLGETTTGCQRQQKQFEPLVEAQLKGVMRDTLLPAFEANGVENAEMKVTMVTWAIAGAALQWSRKREPSAEAFADLILPLAHAPLDLTRKGLSPLVSSEDNMPPTHPPLNKGSPEDAGYPRFCPPALLRWVTVGHEKSSDTTLPLLRPTPM